MKDILNIDFVYEMEFKGCKLPHSLEGPYLFLSSNSYWVNGKHYNTFIEYIKAVITYKEKSLNNNYEKLF